MEEEGREREKLLCFWKLCAIMKLYYHEGSANGQLPKRRPSFLLSVFEFDFIAQGRIIKIVIVAPVAELAI